MSWQGSGLDLGQEVIDFKVYKRLLNSSSGSGLKSSGLVHEGVVVTTWSGRMFLIETGVDPSDDINYSECIRKGKARIVKVSDEEVRGWTPVRSVSPLVSGLTLLNLWDACGDTYSVAYNNCWNAVMRMELRATSGGGLSWQVKFLLLICLAAAVVAVAAYYA